MKDMGNMGNMKKHRLKTFFSDAKKCFDNISGISQKILIIGQLFIFCVLAAFTIYIIHVHNSANPEFFAYAFKTAKVFFDNTIAGLSVLWGGALFIDYVEKRNS